MSKAFTNPPLKQLLDSVPAVRGAETRTKCANYIKAGGSVFGMLEMGREGVMETFGVSDESAQALLERASSLALHAARQFREQQLVRQGPENPLHRSGASALIEMPNFNDLFRTNWEGASPPNTMSARNFAVAYFVHLITLARDLEARAAGGAGLITLDKRRPDLANLVIDATATFQVKPTVKLFNEILEKIIEAYLAPALEDNNQVVDDVLRVTRFPHRSMPFEWYKEQYTGVLDQNRLLLGHVVRAIDPPAPYFKEPGVRGPLSDIALQLSCRLGPQQQQLLTERFVVAGNEVKFYLDNFNSTAAKLLDSVHFCAKADIDALALTRLLSIETFAPTRSPNVPVAAPTPSEFGSTYINSGNTKSIDLSAPVEGSTRQFLNITLNGMDRINRMLRLSRWLDLPQDKVDRLLWACHRAEIRGETVDPAARTKALAEKPIKITNNTLRALGLFREFQLLFRCTIDQFIVLIDEILPFGTGDETPQFDLIFNQEGLFDTPLKADGRFFFIEPKTRDDIRIVDQICRPLGFNLEIWRYLSRFVAKSYNYTDELPCSLPVLSSFYRLALLASFFRLNPIELAALLETLSERGASEVLQRILGESRLLISGTSGVGDVLSVMHAAQSCSQWLKDNDLSVPWLVAQVRAVVTPPIATDEEIMLLQEMYTRVQPTLLSESVFRAAGIGLSDDAETTEWMTLLEQLVDEQGLISSLTNDESDYTRVVAEAEAAMARAGISASDEERVRTVLVAAVLQARDAQIAVVVESLATMLKCAQDLVLPLLKWVDTGGVYVLLKETVRALEEVKLPTDRINPGDRVLNLLGHLARRAEVARKLALTSAMLATLTTARNFEWFGLQDAQNLNLATLYKLTQVQRAVKHTGQPAEKLLNYLRMVNSLPPVLTPEDERLIRDSAATQLAQVLNWGVREVIECILYLGKLVIRDTDDIDTLLHIRELATRSKLDAKALIQLGLLTPNSDKDAYRTAAERVIEVLSGAAFEGQIQKVDEVGQSVTHEIRCINDTLIANVKGQVALIEVWIRDLAGKAMSNITITWEADRPGLLQERSTTDNDGRAVVHFQPEVSKWQGEVLVTARYGLDMKAVGPKIFVASDELTLGFTPGGTPNPRPDEQFLAGGKESFPVHVILMDHYENPGIGRTVTFTGDGLTATSASTTTDENGIARTLITSMAPISDAILVATYASKDARVITNIDFIDSPSITRLEVASVALVGQPLLLHCHVVRLDKTPAPDVEVKLYAGAGTTPIGTATTNQDGIAEFTVAAPAAGKQAYTAKVIMDEQQIEVDVAPTAVIHGESARPEFPGVGTPHLLFVTVRQANNNQSPPVPNCDVWWSYTGPGPASTPVNIPTDSDGRSSYAFVGEAVGDYVVTADRRTGASEIRTFNVKVAPAIAWEWELAAAPAGAVVGQTSASAPLEFIRGQDYILTIKMPTGMDLTGALGMLAFEGALSAKALGMDIEPREGAVVAIGAQTSLQWRINCRDLRNGTFRLIFSCDRFSQRLALDARLGTPAPMLLSPVNGAPKVEVQPLLHGTGTRSAQIIIYGGAGAVLARTSVDADGKWAVRLAEKLSPGPHTFVVTQRNIDATESSAAPVQVTVVAGYAAHPVILKPLTGSKVYVQSWLEGIGLPGVEVRVVRTGAATTIYAQGMVNADGRWRVQLKPELGPGPYKCGAGFYVNGTLISPWMPENIELELIARG